MDRPATLPVVLLVDDEEHIVDNLTEFLQHDFTVLSATHPDKAMSILMEQPVDIIISDLRLPAINGIEFLRRSIDIAPESERILITAYADLSNVIQSINEAKVSYYLTKPIDLPQIRLVVQRAAEMARLRRTNAQLLEELQQSNQFLEEKVRVRNQELQEAHEQLKHLQRTREQMINMAIHDLKNPISNLQLAVSELQRLCPSPEAQELLFIARDSSDIADSLVSDMLTVASLSKLDPDTRREIIEPSALLSASIQAFKNAALRKSITVQADFPTYLPPFSAHTQRLREALDNLISNAIKYTPAGGVVTVSAGLEENNLIIAIRDTGLGMTQEDMQNAFGEFKRLSAQPTNGESSTGLGLFIVKKIIDLHDGTIVISSEGPGKGTVFTLTLPLNQQNFMMEERID
jgi:two-component system sensor histidine kinase/response regulator